MESGRIRMKNTVNIVSRFADIKGKGLGRLLHFISWYCGDELSWYVRAGFCSVENTPYQKWVESLLIQKKAHGFLTINNQLLCFYWWKDDTDIPIFEFMGIDYSKYNKEQEALRELAIKDEKLPPGFTNSSIR